MAAGEGVASGGGDGISIGNNLGVANPWAINAEGEFQNGAENDAIAKAEQDAPAALPIPDPIDERDGGKYPKADDEIGNPEHEGGQGGADAFAEML